MNIDLPNRFSLDTKPKDGYAEVRDGILHMHKEVSYRKLMYNITYEMKGNKKCYYCGKDVNRRNITLDHMYARDCGGPTIPNNLVPCCDECNSEKSSLNAQNYLVFRKMNEEDAEIYKTLTLKAQEISKKSGIFDLPLDWVTTISIDKLIFHVGNNICKSKEFKKQLKFFKKYEFFSKPIVVDRNGFVLEGKEIVFVAMKKDITEVKAIVLDNVEVHI